MTKKIMIKIRSIHGIIVRGLWIGFDNVGSLGYKKNIFGLLTRI